jgi:hypothetical protein
MAGDKGKHSEIFMKTKMCKFHILGMCAKGRECQFAHCMDEMNPLPDLYRTKLCKNLINTGKCDNPTCKYAHNKVELRTANMNRQHGGGVSSGGGRANAKSGRSAAGKQQRPGHAPLLQDPRSMGDPRANAGPLPSGGGGNQPGRAHQKAQMADFQKGPAAQDAGGVRK